jgi:hypothetical protein
MGSQVLRGAAGYLVRVDEVVELAATGLEYNNFGDDEDGQEWAEDGPHHVHEPRRVQYDEHCQVAGVSARWVNETTRMSW